MKTYIMTCLIVVWAAGAAAQSPTPKTEPGDVVVLKFGWHDINSRPNWDEPRNSASSQIMEDTPNASRDSDPRALMPNGTLPQRSRERLGENKRPRSDEPQLPPGKTNSKTQDLPRYLYEARIKNVGDATIAAVEWDYLFIDASQQRELARHRFQSFRKASPGKSLTISGVSLAPPTRVVTAEKADEKAGLFNERVIIRCVAYSDGTVRWTAGGSERDCEGLKNRDQTASTKRGSDLQK